jgi:hypothetical protein
MASYCWCGKAFDAAIRHRGVVQLRALRSGLRRVHAQDLQRGNDLPLHKTLIEDQRRVFMQKRCHLYSIRVLRCAFPFLLCGAIPILAQTSTGADVGEQAGALSYHLNIKARIVVLDVVITDRKGHLVSRSNLTKDSFTLLEDGVRQSVLSFETSEQHTMAVSDKPIVTSSADLQKIGDSPVTILVLDELNS